MSRYVLPQQRSLHTPFLHPHRRPCRRPRERQRERAPEGEAAAKRSRRGRSPGARPGGEPHPDPELPPPPLAAAAARESRGGRFSDVGPPPGAEDRCAAGEDLAALKPTGKSATGMQGWIKISMVAVVVYTLGLILGVGALGIGYRFQEVEEEPM